jgi:hypothetical protein
MSRRVEGPKAKLSGGGTAGGENYPGRLVKYIPAEIVALYLSVRPLPSPATRANALWWIFWVCLTLTPIYLILTTRKPRKGPQWVQVALATIAFPIWVWAVGNGPFDPWRVEGWVITLVLGGTTLLFGAIPAPPDEG